MPKGGLGLPHKAERSSTTALLLVATIIVGVGLLSFFSVQSANEESRLNLEERASTIAAALDPHVIASLNGADTDITTPQYRDIKARLTALKQVNSDTISVYLTGMRGNEVFFYANSERPGTRYYSASGSAYADATAGFKNIFISSPVPFVEGPIQDAHGTRVSGMAPVHDPSTGRVLAVVGVDIDARSYNGELLQVLAVPMGGGITMLAVVALYEWRRRREQQMLRMRSELVSIASHELRSPLTGMSWALEGLLKSAANKAEETKLQAIYKNVSHMQAGIEDILQFSAVTGKKGKLTIAPCDIKSLVQEVCSAQHLTAQQKNVSLVLDDSWPAEVQCACDADRMRRALHNIVSNAIKYTRSGTNITIIYNSSEKYHSISVQDQGIGIPRAEQHKVFGGFYRASNAKASGIEGTGLGLYLTRAILLQHKGKLTFASHEGKGTVFTLYVPKR